MNIEQKDAGEIVTVTFPYSDEIGVAIIDSQVVTISVLKGVDVSPDSVRNGNAQIAGSEVRQSIRAGVIGCRYQAYCLANLSDGRKLGRRYIFDVVTP